MSKIVYFDMDGTIANLYAVENVFDRLDALDASVYSEALPINKYIGMLRGFKELGYKVIILSCLGMISEDKFDKDTIDYKNKWLDKYVGKEYIDDRIFIEYTKHKENYIKEGGILVDDDDKVLMNWKWDRIKANNKDKAKK